MARLVRGAGERPSGPSWANPALAADDTDDLTAALDPTQMEPAAKPAKGGAAPAAAAKPASQDDIAQAPRAIRSAR